MPAGSTADCRLQMPETAYSPHLAPDPALPRRRISASFVVGLSVSLVLHGVLLGLLLMRDGSAGSVAVASSSPLLIDWQAEALPLPLPVVSPPSPATAVAAAVRASTSDAPRSLAATPMFRVDAVGDLPAIDAQPVAATTTETGDHDDAALAAVAQPAFTPAGDEAYVWDVLTHLRRFQHYPERARQRGIEGTVWLRARVSRRGEVLRADIEHSSGQAQLDAAATRLIAQASPLPPPPDGAYAITDLSLPVEYRLHRE